MCGFVFKLQALTQVDSLHDLSAVYQHEVCGGCGIRLIFAQHLCQDLIHTVRIGDMVFAIRLQLDIQSHLLGHIFAVVIECALRHGASIFIL